MTTTIDVTAIVQKQITELPPLPVVVQKLISTLDDDRSSAEDVMKVLTSDQAMASKVLKLVNSSFYGMPGEISTPSRAIVILGFSAVRNLAIGLSAASVLSGADKNENQRRFWEHSISSAAAAQILARHTKYPDPEEAFIAGLLHDIGQMVLMIAVPEEYDLVLATGPDNLLENEEKILGMTHAKAGQMLLKHWGLPSTLTDSIRFHHHTKVFCGKASPLTSLIALADAFAQVHGGSYERSMTTKEYLELLDIAGFDVDDTGELLTELDQRVEETRVFLQIATDEAVEVSQAEPAGHKRIVIISTETVKTTWAREVLTYFGNTVIPMTQFFKGHGEEKDVDVIIVDPDSITVEQMQKMKPTLDATGAPIVLVSGENSEQAELSLGRSLKTIPLAFSRSDFSL
jgi:putative nucleotidyltransferase with HDIG domain